ncbi:hypothetical protein [Cupriavidus sp. UYPR2.512]|uniref:hypothetical protein n=1 Tax=Cupriavidus sp. UYPR2.512 TaxID=1080187 RepID=UPI00035D0ED4|nr:hypothetical protein [Cupriavidus sp. UYPR2.512]UIF90846.1 hypothetical protein KAF44_32170 [Cupriavidus necator]
MSQSPILAALPDLSPADVNIVLQGLIRQREHITSLIALIEGTANQSLAERVAAARAESAEPPANPLGDPVITLA